MPATGSALSDAPLADARLFSGVRTRRSIAFLLDAVIVGILCILAYVLIGVLGIFTLGIGWLAWPLVVPGVPLLYSAFSLGGRHSATVGMRAMGIEVRRLDGTGLDPLIAAVHTVLFWLSVSFLTPLVLVVGLISGHKRLLHDILTGTVAVNRA